MWSALPTSPDDLLNWQWSQIEPYYEDLAAQEITPGNIAGWLANWAEINNRIHEILQRLYVAITVDTTDQDSEYRHSQFLEDILAPSRSADQRLKEKLLGSGLEPAGFEIQLRNMRTEASLYRKANLPLLSEELKLAAEYDKIIGDQTVNWRGQETTISQLTPVYQDTDRAVRESAWRMASARQMADWKGIGDLWGRFMDLRRKLASNAGLPDYRAYRWRQLLRFDYTPVDCAIFHQAIEQIAVPAANRIYEKRRQRLGVSSIRPWDLEVDPLGRPPLRPFQTLAELKSKTSSIFHQVDPGLGDYFDIMQTEGLLDLDNRKGKAPGGYCTEFRLAKRPFIFANSVGIHDDVQTLLHEGGHAFHVFETRHLPYFQQLEIPMEFMEVASMGMELLAAPYLTADQAGFYGSEEAARARIEHLERSILFWPYMAVVDAFQHWVYENHEDASVPANCDAKWADLWARFMPGEDWSGLEAEMAAGWQRKLHIHQVPFYYIEYGLAQLGAVQVWRNALNDQSASVADYRKALSLGGTVPLPHLFETAGARFAFDASTLGEAVDLMESTINRLESSPTL
jgi:oligoendopeptidase F